MPEDKPRENHNCRNRCAIQQSDARDARVLVRPSDEVVALYVQHRESQVDPPGVVQELKTTAATGPALIEEGEVAMNRGVGSGSGRSLPQMDRSACDSQQDVVEERLRGGRVDAGGCEHLGCGAWG